MKNREIILESRIAELEEEIGRLREQSRRNITEVKMLLDTNGQWYSTNEEDCLHADCVYCESITLENDVFTIRFDKSEWLYEGETLCLTKIGVERFVL